MPAPIIYSTTGSPLSVDEISFAHQVATSFIFGMRSGWPKTIRREDTSTGAIVEYHADKNLAYVTPGGGIVGWSFSPSIKPVKWGLNSVAASELKPFLGGIDSSAGKIGGGVILGQSEVGLNSVPIIWIGSAYPSAIDLPPTFSGPAEGTGVSSNGAIASVTLHELGIVRAGKWTKGIGFQYLQGLPSTNTSRAEAISSDGGTIVGFIGNTSETLPNPEEYQVAAYWDRDGNVHEIYPILPGGVTSSEATCVSADGGTIAGTFFDGSTQIAFIWKPSTGPVSMGASPFGDRVFPVDMSDDGNVIVGFMDNPTTGQENAFRWSPTTGIVDLGYLLPGDLYSQARGVSSNGKTIVGESGGKAFKWAEATGMVELLPLPGGTTTSAGGIS